MKTSLSVCCELLCMCMLCANMVSGCYDDTDVREQLKNHEEQLDNLESLCDMQNANLETLQTLVSALDEKKYVTEFTPVTAGDVVLGYTIMFSEGGPITIYCGKDGDRPVIGVKKDPEDGRWYWSVDDEWVTDDSGNRVCASARTGAAGEAGVTPRLKIIDGYWYVSYDGGQTWETETLGQATGDEGYTLFEKVEYDDTHVYITMSDGAEIVLRRDDCIVSDNSIGPAVITLESVNPSSVEFKGHIDLSEEELAFCKVTVYFQTGSEFNLVSARSASSHVFEDKKFSIVCRALLYGTTYDYCYCLEYRGEKMFSKRMMSFTTLPNPYEERSDLDVASAIDISATASANCYIVSQSGLYKFKTVKGNSSEPFGDAVFAEILWETFGTSDIPEHFDLIKAVCYKDGYVVVQTADVFKEGNAVVAVKDADGNILWSWHLWFTDVPQEQVYFNDAGTMMDRNLGAVSAVPGDVGALGLFYQWGRKDPFLGSASIKSSKPAESTAVWPSRVTSDSDTGTIEYAISNPMTFIYGNSVNRDWYYTGDETVDSTRWTTSERAKSIYDPCPAGWRVPDGGADGVWSKAYGSGYSFSHPFDSINSGMNISSGKFGGYATIWYPAAGYSINGYNVSGIGVRGEYWSASVENGRFYGLRVSDIDRVYLQRTYYGDYGYSLRCIRE